MKRSLAVLATLALLLPASGTAFARALSVEVQTDRGNDAVYKPGEPIRIEVRPSEDAYVLVYEIDAEGYVHRLFPYDGTRGLLDGGVKFRLGQDREDAELVAQGPVGQGYVVAIASLDPFEQLPWFFRERNAQADELGYEGQPEEDTEGVTSEGKIVGDPFVAMERIRRQVLADPEDDRAFASSYTSYYVHHEVRYPRYLCNDCHRPGNWSWWDGFDPYYAHCSVFDFRVNYGWYWGPTYWFGTVPYFVYVYRTDCPPAYRVPGRRSWSSWDGWGRWTGLWGENLRRFRTPPPTGYIPPSKYDREFRRPDTRTLPPGFLSPITRDRFGRGVPAGRQIGDFPRSGSDGRLRRDRNTAPDPRVEGGSRSTGRRERSGPQLGPSGRSERNRGEDSAPPPRDAGRVERPRNDAPPPPPAPRNDPPRNDPPRNDRPSSPPPSTDRAPRPDPPRGASLPGGSRDDGGLRRP